MSAPFFSICIPQHNRTSHLIEACRSIVGQTFRDCEICISDDCSTDGRDREVSAFLEAAGLPFVCRRRETNGRYDKNLRSAMDLARGEYLFLLANDDALKDRETLGQLHQLLSAYPAADVAIANFEDYATGEVTRRVRDTRVVGTGPRVAASVFRKFSFVSGIVLRRARAELVRTEAWDGTEMYQMYVGCRVIATGGNLLEADISTVRKDVQIPGEVVDHFSARPRVAVRGVPLQPIPVTRLAALVVCAIEPVSGRPDAQAIGSVIVQYYGFLCPYWVLVYRRVQSWRYAAGVARAFAPSHSLTGAVVPALLRFFAWPVFLAAAGVGLGVPASWSAHLSAPARRLARLAAEWRQPAAGAGRS